MDVGGRLLFIIAQKIIIQYTVASNTNCLDFFGFSNMDITSKQSWLASNKFVQKISIAYYGTCYLGAARSSL